MQLDKKRLSRLPPTAAACAASSTFTIKCEETGMEYLVDTGAARSLVPKSLLRGPHKISKETMRAANGSSIATYGLRNLPVHRAGTRYTWKFLVADVFMPIIGADFLSFYNLSVNVRDKTLYQPPQHLRASKVNTLPCSDLIVMCSVIL